jgi:segregation and condensation protein B
VAGEPLTGPSAECRVLSKPPLTWHALGERLGSVALRYRGDLVERVGRAAGHGLRARFGSGATSDGRPIRSPAVRSAEMARLEAVLFVAREPLGSRKLAQLADLADGTAVRTLARLLDRLYEEEGRAFRVVEVAGGFQLLSRPKFAPWLRRLCSAPAEVRLSGPALETLAVVAYRQPVLRVAIEAVRGVQCGEILRQLMERDLVKIVGRSDELGRPFLYGTTKRFLQVFGLQGLEELPRREWLRPIDMPPPCEDAETLQEDWTADSEERASD